MSTMEEAREWARAYGFETADPIRMRSGETVYLLQPRQGERIGLPQYVRWDGYTFVPSTTEESMALFDEPDYMRDE